MIRKTPLFTSLCLSIMGIGYAQHNNEFYNNGSVVTIQAGAEVHVWGDFHSTGATANLTNNGLIEVQGNLYSDNLFQQRGTGTVRIENSQVNTGERQFISGSYAVRGGQALTGVDDGSFYNLELANDQGIVYLVGTGNIADVRNSINFAPASAPVSNRIVTHDIGTTGVISYPTNGSDYTGVFGMMSSVAGIGNFQNNTIALNGNSSGVDNAFIQGKLRRAISAAGGNYGFLVGLEPAGVNAQRGVQYVRLDFGANNYDCLEGYFQTGLDNTFPTQLECSGFQIDYWGGIDHGQWIFEDITHAGVGVFSVYVWPQDNNFPAKSVWMITKDNSIQGTPDQCGASPFGLVRSGFNGFSQFGVAAADLNVLPIELIDITAKGVTDHIEVDWNVASEQDLSHYELYRSEDGIDFEHIVNLPAAGNSSSPLTYHYDDYDVRYFQQYYYRVKSVDLDGDAEFTPTVTASITKELSVFDDGAVSVYPNPTMDEFSIAVISDKTRLLDVFIYNTMGQVVFQFESAVAEGNTVMQVDASRWAPGVYYIELFDKESANTINKRIIKQH